LCIPASWSYDCPKEKKELYAYIHKHLSPCGCFVNHDVVCPRFDELESGYFSLWRQWIEAYLVEERREELLGTPEKCQDDPENMPDTLKDVFGGKHIGT
jgi:hypothetical protein